MLAAPLDSATGGPIYTSLVLKVTVPVGTLVAGGTALTVAVKVTFEPGKEGFREEVAIVVDEQLRTNVPEVFAAGDVTEAYDLLLERRRPIPILPLAYRQGQIAGRNHHHPPPGGSHRHGRRP